MHFLGSYAQSPIDIPPPPGWPQLAHDRPGLDVGALVDTVSTDDTTPVEDGADGDPVEQGCGESFTGGTKILLASGAAIPISQIKPGDKVLATVTNMGTRP